MLDNDWLLWLSAGVVAFSALSYVLLDGTDLGAGVLLGMTKPPKARREIALTILPVWDANETWLVLGGGGLLALFPRAYAVLLPALYLPFILMFLALLLRAMALEFRDQAAHERSRRCIDALLLVGSAVAAGCQGIVLGTLVQGVPSHDGQYSGQGNEWLSAFPLFCASVLVLGYTWLGACWLYWRTEGRLRQGARRQARWLACATLAALVTLAGWTATLAPQYADRLYDPLIAGPAIVALLTLATGFCLAFRSRWDALPLACALGVFVVAFAFMIATLFPLIVPPFITLEMAASGPASQKFMLAGFALLMPVTLAYNTFGFKVFSGKVRASQE